MKAVAMASVFLMAIGMAACRKDSPDPYAGDFYIRAPLIENNFTYLDPGGYLDGLYIVYNAADRKKLWRIIPIGNNEYNIAFADSTSLLITAYPDLAWLAPKDSALAANQAFRIIIPSPQNPFLVAFQSPSSGKFLQLDYCYKDNETWGYATPMDDSSYCGYQNINLYSQADTCYCMHQFALERN